MLTDERTEGRKDVRTKDVRAYGLKDVKTYRRKDAWTRGPTIGSWLSDAFNDPVANKIQPLFLFFVFFIFVFWFFFTSVKPEILFVKAVKLVFMCHWLITLVIVDSATKETVWQSSRIWTNSRIRVKIPATHANIRLLRNLLLNIDLWSQPL